MREAQIGAFGHQQAGSREQLAEIGSLRGFSDVSWQVLAYPGPRRIQQRGFAVEVPFRELC